MTESLLQSIKYKRSCGTSKSKIASDLHDHESSSDTSSDEEDSPSGLNYRTPLVTQVV